MNSNDSATTSKPDEDIRDLKINTILDDLKSKKINIDEIREQVDFKKNTVFSELQSRAEQDDAKKRNEIKQDYFKEENDMYNNVPKRDFREIVDENQNDIHMMLANMKQKNKTVFGTGSSPNIRDRSGLPTQCACAKKRFTMRIRHSI